MPHTIPQPVSQGVVSRVAPPPRGDEICPSRHGVMVPNICIFRRECAPPPRPGADVRGPLVAHHALAQACAGVVCVPGVRAHAGNQVRMRAPVCRTPRVHTQLCGTAPTTYAYVLHTTPDMCLHHLLGNIPTYLGQPGLYPPTDAWRAIHLDLLARFYRYKLAIPRPKIPGLKEPYFGRFWL